MQKFILSNKEIPIVWHKFYKQEIYQIKNIIAVPKSKCDEIERELIKQFLDTFTKDISGNEYFKGDYKLMVKMILDHCKIYYE